jgi:hypothetical protein
MASEHSDVKPEIGHVLFIDIVGYSKLLNPESKSLQSDRRFTTLMNKVGFTEP